jgi:hypothetical protein
MEEKLDAESEFRTRYLDVTGLQAKDLDAALRLAYDHRKFEIELYWRRATYFWAFQAVAFASVGLFLQDGALPSNSNIMFVPVLLGAITGAVGWLTSAGSKFWQENWESHVDLLENEMSARMTAAILFRDEPRFSVSKLNQVLLACLFIGWISAFVYLCAPSHFEAIAAWQPWVSPLAALIFLVASLAALLKWGRTQLSGVRHELGAQGWRTFGTRRDKVQAILWRDSLGLRPKPRP